MDLEERAKRCRVMWEKARNMYSAFFSELSDVMALMPEKEFDDWCFKSVGVSLNVAIKASEVLKAADQLRVQTELKRAAAAKKEADKIAKETTKQDILDLKAKQAATQLTIEKNKTAIHQEQAVNSLLRYDPHSPEVAEILAGLASRQAKTRLDNGLDYIRLKDLVKSGAEGADPDTGKKWKWEKWAELAIGRPINTIQKSMKEAKIALSKNRTDVRFSDNHMKPNGNSAVVDKVYDLGLARSHE